MTCFLTFWQKGVCLLPLAGCKVYPWGSHGRWNAAPRDRCYTAKTCSVLTQQKYFFSHHYHVLEHNDCTSLFPWLVLLNGTWDWESTMVSNEDYNAQTIPFEGCFPENLFIHADPSHFHCCKTVTARNRNRAAQLSSKSPPLYCAGVVMDSNGGGAVL